MDTKLIHRIIDAAGEENCLLSPEDRACYAYDAGLIKDIPDIVVLPESSRQVSELIKICNDSQIPVYPRGAGSGTAGASVPLSPGLVISMSRFNRIVSVSAHDLQAVVEPGVVTGDLQRAVEKKGLFYPPDPASLNFCTVGGNVNTGAGGARAVKYGVTKDYVVSLEVCLADGTLINTSSATAKGVAGYDLTRLMVGSEGTLGVITQITLKLIPRPEASGAMMAFFPDVSSAARGVGAIFENGLLPRCAEFLDRKSIRCTADKMPIPVPEEAGAMLIVEVDGPESSIGRQLRGVEGCFSENSVISIFVPENRFRTEALWAARRALSPAIKTLGFRHKINEDICVPRHALPEMMERLEEIEKRYDLCIVTFGHAGDGNLHVNVLHNGPERDGYEPAAMAVREIMETAVSMGGTISGEHGIGLAKLPFMEIEFAPRVISIMKGIKQVFDPLNILNPHKVLPALDYS